ncbi:hypothetical protein ACIHCQ_28085 [Streptomyces sp. NPDC052236]|uniref:hypothetical protein n=1 Tax=Streptomyces sp. NPDC052236 TaxID=3365686 RepID=UPI0037CF2197
MSETAYLDEQLLRRGLHELAESESSPGSPPAVGALVGRGRRARWRRRATAVTVSAALLGVVGAGGVYGGMLDGGEGANVAAPPTPDGVRTVDILKNLLPEGTVSQEREGMPGSAFASYAGGSLVFDDGKGAAAISISLGRVDSPAASLASLVGCARGPKGGSWGPYGTCTSEKLADGSTLILAKSFEAKSRAESRSKDPKIWTWEALLYKQDGSILTLKEWNAPAQKGVKPTRADPPLTRKQLTDFVTAREWHTTLDSFPRRGGGVHDEGAPSGFEIKDTLIPLLPSSLKPAGLAGGTSPNDFLSLGVNDGKGGAAVEVNIDHRGTNDGDRVRIHERQGLDPWSGKDLRFRSVTAVRPGGFRVVVTTYNGYAFGDATRATPPLTMKQLRAIATSEEWDKFK